MTDSQSYPGSSDALPEWEDADVQTVYQMLCDDALNMPPNPEEHWEGWISRNIVRAMRARTGGVAQSKHASPQEVQEACAQVADREAETRKREEANHRDSPKDAYVVGREVATARRIATSIRALIPPAQCSPDHIEIKRLSGLLADAQRIIAEYKAGTTAGAKADVAAHGLPGARGQAMPRLENLADRFVSIIQDGIAQAAGSKSIASMIINELLLLRIVTAGPSVTSTQSGGAA